MKSIKTTLALLLALAMLAGAAACTPAAGPQEEEKVLVVGSSTEPIHFNGNAADSAGGYASANIFSGLFATTVTGKILNDLAESYTISEDGLTYTIKLHENVKWHDGEAFSSNDVKFTIDTVINEKGQDYDYFTSVQEITCPDDNTVVFTLKQVCPPFILYLSYPDILPAHLYEGTDWLDNPANLEPIGTGPFKFESHEKGTSITLVAFEDYFLGAPKIDRIVYKTIPDENAAVQAYLNGEIDVLDLADAVSPSAMPTLEAVEGTHIATMISADRQYLLTNASQEPWSDARVRKAVALAVDRAQCVEMAHKGYAEVAEGFYTPAVDWAYAEQYTMPDRDVEAAKALLDEAGYAPDANGVRIADIDIVIFQFAVFTDIATIVKANLEEIGITAQITSLEYAAWAERCERGDFDIAVIGGYHGPDPSVMRMRIGEGGLLNYGKYYNEEIEQLLDEGETEPDEAKRIEIYDRMQQVMSEDFPVLPLTEWCYILVCRDYITGHYCDLKDEVPSASYYSIDIVSD